MGLDLVARHAFHGARPRGGAGRGNDDPARHPSYVEEIIPEIERVVLLRRGRIDRDGAKPDVLTAEALSHAFDAPLSVEEAGGYFHVRVS